MKEQELPTEQHYFVVFPTYLLDELSAKRCVLAGVLLSLSRKEGYAYIGNKSLAKIMRCSDDMIQKDLQYLDSHGYISRQVIRNDNGEIVMRKIYPLPLLIKGGIVNFGDTLSEQMGNRSSKKLGIDTHKDISIKNNVIVYTEEFDTVWIMYGKKGNKMSSYKSWLRLTREEHGQCVIHIPNYIENHKMHGKSDYLPHLSTYLNQKRWTDELPYSSTKNHEKLSQIKWS
jgi:hypothetical protein